MRFWSRAPMVYITDRLPPFQPRSEAGLSLAEKQLLNPLTLDFLTMFCIILYIHTLCQSYSQETRQKNKNNKLFFYVKLLPHSFNHPPLISLLENRSVCRQNCFYIFLGAWLIQPQALSDSNFSMSPMAKYSIKREQ